MKFKSLLLLAATVSLLTACGKKEQTTSTEQTLAMTQTELAQAVADQDSLLTLMNEIQGNMVQIKQLEHILNTPDGSSESIVDRRQTIRDDIAAIQNELQSRREKLEALERRLRDSKNQNQTLLTSIETLKSQIATQEATITDLRQSLAQANTRIESLNRDVDSLSTTVAIVTEQRQEAQDQNTRLSNELNYCYYVIGTKKDLKDKDLISTGFLRSARVNPQDFEVSYFTRADKRTLSLLPLNSKKAKVMTSQPSESYSIETDAEGFKSLRILDAARFWEVSNFLVVQID